GRELAGRRKDGTEFPVEISLAPVTTADELYVFATVVDITARKAAEGALADSEQRFRTVLEAAPNAIVAIDREGSITYGNPQVQITFGYELPELIGSKIEILLPERLLERHQGHRHGFFDHPVARPMGIGLDLAGRRKDGREFPVEISLSPVVTAEGLQVFATVVDITARKTAEQELLQAQKMESIGRLAGGIAHDFNNMLSAIRGFAELLHDDLELSPLPPVGELQHSVEAVRGAADRAAVLTAQLLAFSRRQVLAPVPLNVAIAVRAVEPMLRRLIGERVQLGLKLDPGTGIVRADPGQVDQILLNLVVNARDAMPDGGTVTIETGNITFEEPYAIEHFELAAGPYVMLAVTDTGLGMERDTREHIFEPFFTTKEQGRGTGLGLATIYGIVRQSGGHIWLYSEPGKGTSFKLYFPRVEITQEHAQPPSAPEARSASGLVMVVEDEPAVREYTCTVLERKGFRVVAVANAAEALAWLETGTEPIDALVTDVVMPGLSGPQLAKQIADRGQPLGLVLVSGYTEETLDLADLLARGAIFVAKPFTPLDLSRAVNAALTTPLSVTG
ncbi:MAG TPA: PAS domain S-box protein, partial [Candidatus Limnocylindrales bacterium]|nr:PAS domain S-box protein [Candidatus Limnocylindrales bacterium]